MRTNLDINPTARYMHTIEPELVASVGEGGGGELALVVMWTGIDTIVSSVASLTSSLTPTFKIDFFETLL